MWPILLAFAGGYATAQFVRSLREREKAKAVSAGDPVSLPRLLEERQRRELGEELTPVAAGADER